MSEEGFGTTVIEDAHEHEDSSGLPTWVYSLMVYGSVGGFVTFCVMVNI